MKPCYRCHNPIYEPELPDTAVELCPGCDETSDGLSQLKQEAFVAGINLGPISRPCRNRVVLDSSLER